MRRTDLSGKGEGMFAVFYLGFGFICVPYLVGETIGIQLDSIEH